jgi:hypothetical protein
VIPFCLVVCSFAIRYPTPGNSGRSSRKFFQRAECFNPPSPTSLCTRLRRDGREMEVKGFVEILAIGCLCSHYQVQGPYDQLPTEPLSKDRRMQTATYIKSGGEQTAHRR